MNTQPTPSDDSIEALLRKPSAPIADAGFTARVLATLPPPKTKPRLLPSRRIILCSLGTLAGAICAVAQSTVPLSEDLQSFGSTLGSALTGFVQSTGDLRTLALLASTIAASCAVAYFHEIVAKLEQLS